MAEMTSLEKSEFEKMCIEEAEYDLTIEDIEKMLQFEENRKIHGETQSKDTLLNQLESVIFPENLI